MASFQAKIVWKRTRKSENKNCLSVPLLPDGKYKIPKIEKKKKIPLWLYFMSKQDVKGREREKIKIIVPFRTNPMRNRKFQNNSKKIQKIKKYHYGVISSQNQLEEAQREKIKIIVSFRSALTLQIKFKKNRKKIQ